MNAFATLGDIEFEVMYAPSTLESKYSAIYAEHALINRKPSLQGTGSGADDMTWGIKLHASYCNPGQVLKALTEHLHKKSALSFVLANGEYKGVFVILDISESMIHNDPSGNRIETGLNLTLKEYTGDPAKPNPPGVISTNAPNITAIHFADIPPLATPDSLMTTLQSALSVAATVGDAAGKVNAIAQAYQSGDILGALGAAGTYAPALAEMAAMLPVEELQDLQGTVNIAVDAGTAATAIAQTRNFLTQASTQLSSANGLSGLNSASGLIQNALTSSASAAPSLARLEAVAQVGSRLSGLFS